MRLHSLHLPAAAILGCATFLPAQIAAGDSIAVVTVTPTAPAVSFGEIYSIDHDTATATQLTISTALASERPNSVLMVNGALGYVGTNPPLVGTTVVPADVYAITIAGTTVTAVKLNLTPTAGNNVAQMAIVGARLYFTTQQGGAGGVLQSVLIAGGPVTVEVDLATITGVTGLTNAMCAIGRDVYVSTFDSGATLTPGSLVKWDTTTSTASLVMTLPPGKFVSGTSTFNTGIVNMRENPEKAGTLVLQGVYGDYLVIDPATATVVQHEFAGFKDPGTSVITTNLVNSFAWDAARKDYLVGSRDGFIDHVANWHSGEKVVPGVGTGTVATQNSVGGIDHIQATVQAKDYTNGAGCPGNGGYTPTDVGIGLPSPGNAGFKVALFSGTGGDKAALLLGIANPATPLASIGMPGCVLRTNIFLTVPVTLSGAGNGVGTAVVNLPIPTGVSGTVYRQWAEVNATPVNPLGIIMSNGRQMIVQ